VMTLVEKPYVRKRRAYPCCLVPGARMQVMMKDYITRVVTALPSVHRYVRHDYHFCNSLRQRYSSAISHNIVVVGDEDVGRVASRAPSVRSV
jgi:hypothetical protein